MGFERDRLPDPAAFYEGEGLRLVGRGKWRTACCPLHGGESLRINLDTGAFCCMGGCDLSGGDVLAYRMKVHGEEFIEAARALGAWVDDGQPARPEKPRAFSARAGLEVLSGEALIAWTAAHNLAAGVDLTAADRERLTMAVRRIQTVREACHA
jgi:hypothetical protein